MGLLLVATAISILGLTWAKRQDDFGMDRLNQFGNAAGILTRVLTVFDALRQVAAWFLSGRVGQGPLNVPMPARGPGQATPTMAGRPPTSTFNNSSMDASDLYIGDPVGKDLGLPPKMTAPAVVFP